MSIKNVLLSFSYGLFLAVFVLGLLPCLVIFSWTEMFGMSELYTSPVSFLEFLFKSNQFK